MRTLWIPACVVLFSAACAQSPTAPTVSPIPTAPDLPAPPVPYQGPAIVTHGGESARPRPTVITLALDAETSWKPPFSTIADRLVDDGWLGVSLDLPAHGADVRPGETADPMAALTSWRDRVAHHEDFITPFLGTLRAVIDGLVTSRQSDPSQIVLVGISRGALLAVDAAAGDPRVAAVAILIPVTDLAALDEFAGLQRDPIVISSAAITHAAALRVTPVFVETSQSDIRIDAARALAFADAVEAAGGTVERHIEPTNLHVLPESALQHAVTWLRLQHREPRLEGAHALTRLTNRADHQHVEP
jgi:dienelactone hydrolase